MLKFTTKGAPRCAGPASMLAIGLFASAAHADLVFNGDGSSTVTPYFQAQTYLGEHDHVTATGPGFSVSNGTISSNNTGLGGQSYNGSIVLNGATVSATASATPGGFLTSRNAATLTISNANAQDGYYVLAGYGSMTTGRFFTVEALAARANFTWRVTGTESPMPAGECIPSLGIFNACASARIDFAATAVANPNYFDMVTPGSSYDTMTGFGPGTYTYSIAGMPLDQVITFGYWTSAFIQINPGQLAQGGNYSFFSNYANTYDLIGIDLYDADDNLLTGWSLEDEFGTTVFTPTGRVDTGPVDVPEPGTLSLIGFGLLGAIAARRKRTWVS